MRKLDLLPEMRCDDGCGACCGVVPASETEYAAVVALARQKAIVPAVQGMTCPFYQAGKCQVYEARPMICRTFGHVPEMPCIKGYNQNVDRQIVQDLMKESRTGKTVLLHDALVEFGLVKSTDEVLGSIGRFVRYAITGERNARGS